MTFIDLGNIFESSQLLESIVDNDDIFSTGHLDFIIATV